MSDSENLERVGLLGEEFMERKRRGENPTIEEYVKLYPQYGEQIQDLFPSLALLEDLAPENSASFGSPVIDPPLHRTADDQDVTQIGDFRIIREVGRGGMGVVYEAEQESLGRHVALKVLPSTLLPDQKQKLRFEREAKAAAQLHHTNIVPVFGVGREAGLHYYVMQFIQGLGLDAVLDELRRFQDKSKGSTGRLQIDIPDRTDSPVSVFDHTPAATMAQSLLDGSIAFSSHDDPTEIYAASDPAPKMDSDFVTAGRTTSDSISQPLTPDSISASKLRQDRINDPSSATSNSSIKLPSSSDASGATGKPAKSYWHSVANIGIQVASALQHAHEQGITHRDIKPANLLLDMRGCVWVTDFGLAKAEDSENLTHTGDILGTLRYMPPEAFDGHSDHRGDIYSLGLTLYELLALRPAYSAADRNSLVRRVINADVEALNQLNPDIPRDLTTIVHKAIDADASRRYQRSGELAEDLRRFISDQPIHARRISVWEHTSRWAKRNRMLAGSIAAVASLLFIIAIGATIAAFRFQKFSSDLAIAKTATEIQASQNLQLAELEIEARKDAEEAQRQSAHNFEKAIGAVESYLDKVTEEKLLAVPGLQPLRNELLQSALEFYKDFASQNGDSPLLQRKLAAALTRIGRINTELGVYQEAMEFHLRAKGILTSLKAAESPQLSLRLDAANHHEAYGLLLLKQGDVKDAVKELNAAEELLDSVANTDVLTRAKQIRVLGALSDAYQSIGGAQDAFTVCQQMIQLLGQQRSGQVPGGMLNSQHMLDFQLAKALTKFAMLHELVGYDSIRQNSVGMVDQPILKLFDEAIELQEELLAQEVDTLPPSYVMQEHASTLAAKGRHLLRLRNLKGSLGSFLAASTYQQRLVRENPAVPEHKFTLAENRSEIGRVYQELGDLPKAKANLSNAVKILMELDVAFGRRNAELISRILQLTQVYLLEENVEAALRAMEQVDVLAKQISNPSPTLMFEVAGAWADCLNAGTPIDSKMLGNITPRVLSALEQAVELGFQDYQRLASHESLARFESNKEFKKLAHAIRVANDERGWQTDLEKARTVARQSGKNLLVFFDASDWCIYCATIRAQVLEQKQFMESASGDFVLVSLDFPHGDKPQFYERDQLLREKWSVRGFPLFVYCDPELRRVYQRQGGGDLDSWIEESRSIHEEFALRDAAMERAERSSTNKKLQYVAEALDHISPEFQVSDYPNLREILDEYIDSGPHDIDLDSTAPNLLVSIALGHKERSIAINETQERSQEHAIYSQSLFKYLHGLIPDNSVVAMNHARFQLDEILASKPDWPQPWQLRGQFVIPHLNQNQLWHFAGSVEFLQGNMEAAIEAFNREEQHLAGKMLLSLAHLELGQKENAKSEFASAWRKIEKDGLGSISDALFRKVIDLGQRWPDVCSLRRRAALLMRKQDWAGSRELYAQLAEAEPENEEWQRRLKQLSPDTVAAKNFDLGPEAVSVFGASVDNRGDGALTISPISAPVFGVDFWKDDPILEPGFYELSVRMECQSELTGILESGSETSQTFVSKVVLPSTPELSDVRILFYLQHEMAGLSFRMFDSLEATLRLDAVSIKRSSLADAIPWTDLQSQSELPQVVTLRAKAHAFLAMEAEQNKDAASASEHWRIAEQNAAKLFAPFWDVDLPAYKDMELMRQVGVFAGPAELLFSTKSNRIRLTNGEKTVPQDLIMDPMFGPTPFMYLAYPYAVEGSMDRAQTLASLPLKFKNIMPPQILARMHLQNALFQHWVDDEPRCLEAIGNAINIYERSDTLAPDFDVQLPLRAFAAALEFQPTAPDLHVGRAKLLATANRGDELEQALADWAESTPDAAADESYQRFVKVLSQKKEATGISLPITHTWAEAASELREKLASGDANDTFLWMDYGISTAMAVQQGQDEISKFEDVTSAMLRRFAGSTKPSEVERTLKVCLLLESTADLSKLRLEVIGETLQSNRLPPPIRPFFELVLGLQALREGNFQVAIQQAKTSLVSTAKAPEYQYVVEPTAHAILSLARSHLGLLDQAKRDLEQAQAKLDFILSDGVYIGTRDGVSFDMRMNPDAAILRLLTEQARTILLSKQEGSQSL